jgi:hypothetical protein
LERHYSGADDERGKIASARRAGFFGVAIWFAEAGVHFSGFAVEVSV